MELSKQDTKMTKGLAILFMVLLHLFCRKTGLPYEVLLRIGGVPLVYYIGLFGDCCVAIYCFCSGYAHYLLREKEGKGYFTKSLQRLLLLLVNYWIVILLFWPAGMLFDDSGRTIYSLSNFLQNLFAVANSGVLSAFNGAHWFVMTYIILTLLSPLLFRFIRRVHPAVTLAAVTVVYIIAYLLRFQKIAVSIPDVYAAKWIFFELCLLGTSLLPYAAGMLFYRLKVFTRINKLYARLPRFAGPALLGAFFCGMFASHAVFQSLIVAPLTGIGTVICFNLWKKPKPVRAVFDFFGTHSTNIWLTHMFFFDTVFVNFAFLAKYPLPIFLFTIALSLAASYLVMLIHKPMAGLMEKKIFRRGTTI